jgi:hypothetical protein
MNQVIQQLKKIKTCLNKPHALNNPKRYIKNSLLNTKSKAISCSNPLKNNNNEANAKVLVFQKESIFLNHL